MLPGLRNIAVGRSKSKTNLSSESCFENTKPELEVKMIYIKKVGKVCISQWCSTAAYIRDTGVCLLKKKNKGKHWIPVFYFTVIFPITYEILIKELFRGPLDAASRNSKCESDVDNPCFSY